MEKNKPQKANTKFPGHMCWRFKQVDSKKKSD